MQIEFIRQYAIRDLVPAEYNPRKLDTEKFEKLKESLRRFGAIKPVIVNGGNGILTAGHQRTRAMKAIGMSHCPAVRINGITQTDEIRFNLFHNSIETNKSEVYVRNGLGVGEFTIIRSDDIEFAKNANATIVFEMGRLINKYGEWGSIVCNSRGRVLLNSDYAVASKQLNRDVICYTIPDADEKDMLEYLSIEYGRYAYDSLGVKSYNQLHCQMNRLQGKKNVSITSTTYENYVIPRMKKGERVIDFGAGKCAYAHLLRKKGYSILPYEPHFQRDGKLDVREVVQQILAVQQDMGHHGLYDMVVLDSVLNSVVNSEFERYVLTTCNSLIGKGGTFITGTRNKDFEDSALSFTRANSRCKRLEFMDKNNFSATFRAGVWTMQHFHTRDSLKQLLSLYFRKVETMGTGSQIYGVASDPLPLDIEAVREAIEIEFNMEYPGEYRHNRHKGLCELIVNLNRERNK